MNQKPKNFANLSESTAEWFASIVNEIGICFAEASKSLRDAAAQGADMPIDKEMEETKRETIRLWREYADHFDALAESMRTSSVSIDQFRDEVAGLLLHGVACVFRTPLVKSIDRSTLESLMRERANNIAMAYSGRILPEKMFKTK